MSGDEDYNEFQKSYAISGADKIDWRTDVRKWMDYCIFVMGNKKLFSWGVKKLVEAVDANFFGLDVTTPLHEFMNELKIRRAIRVTNEMNKLRYKPKSLERTRIPDRQKILIKIEEWYYLEIFRWIRNFWASKRGMLFGSKRTEGGHEMPD